MFGIGVNSTSAAYRDLMGWSACNAASKSPSKRTADGESARRAFVRWLKSP
jgi:hypothetical protein